MYKKDDGQISFDEFYTPFGKLDKGNRWVKIADMINWRKYEDKYAERFCENNGTPAVRFRMAMGALIIKQKTGHSDDMVLQDIIENPYMQYLIGLHQFTTMPPFSQSSFTNFRKYITADMIKEINDDIFKGGDSNDRETGGDLPGSGEARDAAGADEETVENKGIMLLDATCAPANIAYPTDVRLLNEAREKLEGMIDALQPVGFNGRKPRTYRKKARKDYLNFAMSKKSTKKSVRKAVGQQLRYVRRNLGYVEKMIERFSDKELSNNQRSWLETIRKLYDQQKEMYDNRTHSVANRIVSISQPHVRPIVRGKARAAVEFGAKVSIHMIEGYAFIDKIGWDAYNEEALLIPAIQQYKKRYGYYPEAVLVDKLYRNRQNLAFCKERGIRVSGPRLGRPPKETDKAIIRQQREDASGRNAVEGKFGEGKTMYGLDRIMARLMNCSETVIAMSFFCMNIGRSLRGIFCLVRSLVAYVSFYVHTVVFCRVELLG